ncbi:MAG: alpha-L-arabinofuranosidase C-terminal domain-containing protein [Candidatus Cyclobacteriaceae bacterium M3_2C_046]
MNKPAIILAVFIFFFSCQPVDEFGGPTIIVTDSVINKVDSRIFGQFLEKPSWGGEIGPEAAWLPAEGRLQDSVFLLLKELHIPVLRFPGGTDVDHLDWRDMVDNVPGRAAERPTSIGIRGDTVTNLFGYDEALQLAEELGSEMILVVNFGQAYFGEKPVEEAALDVASLIAYCNAPLGATLPKGMYDWPSLREKNGRAEPYHVRYVQIANEPWILDKNLKIHGDIDDSLRHHFFDIHKAYIHAIRLVDPDIEIIVDGNCQELAAHLQSELGDEVQYAAYHVYYPWQLQFFKQDGENVSPDTLSEEKIWNAWVAFPQMNEAGNAVIKNDGYAYAKNTGYPVAVTEWNWNGWWHSDLTKNGLKESKLAQGIGAAGFLHAFMREGENIQMGIQSMVLGNSWGITGIRVDPEQKTQPHFYPTGKVTGFYANNHGSELLQTITANVSWYEQPYQMNALQAKSRVNNLDILATRSEDRVFLHLINRQMNEEADIKVEMSGFKVKGTANYKVITGPVYPDQVNMIEEQTSEVQLKKNNLRLQVPARSVSVVIFNIDIPE